MAVEYRIQVAKSTGKIWNVAKQKHPELRRIFDSGVLKIGPFKLRTGQTFTLPGYIVEQHISVINKALDAGLILDLDAIDKDGADVVGENLEAAVEEVVEEVAEPEEIIKEVVPEPEPEPEPAPEKEAAPEPKPAPPMPLKKASKKKKKGKK